MNIAIAAFTMRRKCREAPSQLESLTPSYSTVMRQDAINRNETPPPNYSFVIKSNNRTGTAISLPPPYEDEDQLPSLAEDPVGTFEEPPSFEVHLPPEDQSVDIESEEHPPLEDHPPRSDPSASE